jgi:cytochrome c biogenesis protein CcmG/thiol:disulfide interchange protein DsbE
MLLLVYSAIPASMEGQNGGLRPDNQRKPAPELQLEDSDGKEANLRDYRGKVAVLDFWATWCHGCKEEIPWFAELQRKYGKEGVNVIGVSLDEEGWKVVKPFIKATSVPYRIVLGNDSVAKAFAIGQMPDAFIIDRRGHVAAAYVGMVDKDRLEKNIREVLAEK